MDREGQDERQQGVRASDADRDHTITLLRRHHVEGRLDWDEFSERLDRASRARTREELRELMTDLPPTAEQGAQATPTRQQSTGPWSGGPRPSGPTPGGPWYGRRYGRRWPGGWRRPWLIPPIVGLVILGAVLLGAWAFGGPGPYHRGFFFPVFPLLFWGFLLFRFILPRRRWGRW
jgi:hypothetical protein